MAHLQNFQKVLTNRGIQTLMLTIAKLSNTLKGPNSRTM
jgi:hypothetical protein